MATDATTRSPLVLAAMHVAGGGPADIPSQVGRVPLATREPPIPLQLQVPEQIQLNHQVALPLGKLSSSFDSILRCGQDSTAKQSLPFSPIWLVRLLLMLHQAPW